MCTLVTLNRGVFTWPLTFHLKCRNCDDIELDCHLLCLIFIIMKITGSMPSVSCIVLLLLPFRRRLGRLVQTDSDWTLLDDRGSAHECQSVQNRRSLPLLYVVVVVGVQRIQRNGVACTDLWRKCSIKWPFLSKVYGERFAWVYKHRRTTGRLSLCYGCYGRVLLNVKVCAKSDYISSF